MTGRRISPSLVLKTGKVCCASCGHGLAPAGRSWKRQAAMTAVPVAGLPGAGLGVDAGVVVRRFACPKCGTLLDSETALPEDPFLEDTVAV